MSAFHECCDLFPSTMMQLTFVVSVPSFWNCIILVILYIHFGNKCIDEVIYHSVPESWWLRSSWHCRVPSYLSICRIRCTKGANVNYICVCTFQKYCLTIYFSCEMRMFLLLCRIFKLCFKNFCFEKYCVFKVMYMQYW